MANLPENQLYSPASETYSNSSMANALKSLVRNYSSKKAVGVSPIAKNVATNVQSYAQPQPPQQQSRGTVTVPYGGRTRYESFHPAVDIASPINTPLSSFSSGRVAQVVSGKKQGDKGYGNYIILVDDQGNKHRYSHLSQSYVKVGDVVPKGFRLGTIGNTGSTYSESGGTGAHLDYRVMDAWNKYINPSRFLRISNKV
jgi:murein DD-endopeptidase MepM/ murein hydrolase activator NlpD